MRQYNDALDALRFTEEEQAMLTKKTRAGGTGRPKAAQAAASAAGSVYCGGGGHVGRQSDPCAGC